MKNIWAFVLLLPLLAACMDINEDFAIAGDGSAVWQLELSLNASILGLAQEQGEQDSFCIQDDNAITDVGEVTFRSFARDDQLVCQITLKVEELSHLNFSETMAATERQRDILTGLSVEDRGDGIWHISHDYSPLMRSTEDIAEDVAMAGMMLQGRGIHVTLTAPHIVDSNGEISADGTEVRWDLPLSLALTPGASVARVFNATIQLDTGWFDWLWRLLGLKP